jgi:protein-tyrosine phosphatase
MSQISILFVCMGNICRSPTAEGVFRAKIEAAGLAHRVHIDSAGTHNYHLGSPPDERSQAHAQHRGYDLSVLRARQVTEADYERFDLLLAMDWDNLALLQSDCPDAHQRKLRLFMSFSEDALGEIVPDPYHGGSAGFEHTLDLVESASEGLVRHVSRCLGQKPISAL